MTEVAPPDAKLARRAQEDRLAADIVDECRVQLMLKFRFLDAALWRMEVRPLRAGARYPLATDATQVVCDPPRVIARFQESFEESVRDYLHLVLHCIFRHPFYRDHDNREAWDLTCDIVAEGAALDLCGERFASADDAARREALGTIAMLVGNLLPNKVYGLVKGLVQTPDGQQYRGLGRSTLKQWHVLFERDDHGAWPSHNAGKSDEVDQNASEDVTEDDENPEAQADPLRTDTPDTEAANAQGSEVDESQPEDETAAEEEAGEDDSEVEPDEGADEATDVDTDTERQEREWEDIAKQIEMNLETFSQEWGKEAASLVANLAFANRPLCSYTDFLRRFMTLSEEMRLNMDEFDYVYYTFGLDLYGDMPLVEPLEYKETERVRDFAIVIDTSESVRGDLVKRFVGHTFDILKSSEDFASEVNIHLIQCDAKVQSDTVITSLADVDKLTAGLQIRGFGGTDFRPAFNYVDMLRKRGELANMKGLIYFTDGLGTFPEKPPAFEAAFVFLDEEGVKHPPVPPWACKILIDEAGIGRLRTGSRTSERPLKGDRAL